MGITYKKIRVKTWYLKYVGLIPSININFNVELWDKPNTVEYLKLYNLIGEKWGWSGRLMLSKSDLQILLDKTEIEVWLFKQEDELKGYIEIDRSEKGKAEIVYFGLLPTEIGKGFGKAFLDTAIFLAAKNNDEVWLHTCEFDHPKALGIYIKAGFKTIEEHMDEEYYSIEFLDNIGVSQ